MSDIVGRDNDPWGLGPMPPYLKAAFAGVPGNVDLNGLVRGSAGRARPEPAQPVGGGFVPVSKPVTPVAEARAAAAKGARPPIPHFEPFTGVPGWPALKELATKSQFVAWKYVAKPGKPKPDKVPINPHTGYEAKSNDPATWGTYKEAENRARSDKLPGVGFMLSASDDLTGIDLDDCRDPSTGVLEPWAAEIVALAETYAEVSPSGKGVRLFARGKVDKATKHNPAGVEVYGTKRYLTITGQHVEGTPDTIGPAPETLRQLLERVATFKAAAKAEADAKARPEIVTPQGPPGSGGGFFSAVNSAALANLAAWVPVLLPAARPSGTGYRVTSADLGRDLEEDLSITTAGIVDFGVADQGDAREGRRSPIDLVMEHGGAADPKGAAMWLCERLGVTSESLGWRDGAVVALEAGPEGRADTPRLDDFYSHMGSHQYIHVPTGELWPPASVDGRLPRVPIPTSSGSEPKLMRATSWLDVNRPVDQMTWHPGKPRLIEGFASVKGVLVPSPGGRMFNQYRAPNPSAKGDPTDVKLWLDHLHKLFDEQDVNHIVAWMAHHVQYPGVKCNHALVFAGVPGIGKDSIIEPLVRAVGPGNFNDIKPEDLFGNFTGHMECIVLRINEIHDLGDKSRYDFYDKSKMVIATPPELYKINKKYMPEYYCPNVCGVIMTTNDMLTMHLAADDRRHFIAFSPLEQGAVNPNVFDALYSWYESGGYGNVAAYLRAYDLAHFNPKAFPRRTRAFHAIVAAGRAPEADELASTLDAMGGPAAVTLDQVRAATGTTGHHELGTWLDDRRNRARVGHRLREAGYTAVLNDTAESGLWRVGGQRVKVYARADLTEADRQRAAAALAAAAPAKPGGSPRQTTLSVVK